MLACVSENLFLRARLLRMAAFLALALAGAAQADASGEADRQRQAQAVTIPRDDWGIAHVHGKTDADAVFGMAYAQAEDDFNRVETNYLNAMGRLAEAEGDDDERQDRDRCPTITVVGAVLFGAFFGLVWALLGYALTRGRRDFVSVSQVVATRYEVLTEHKYAQQARDLLDARPGRQLA